MAAPHRSISFTLNGRAARAAVAPHDTVVEMLQRDFGLFGARESCGQGLCGCCTVVVDGTAVSGCLYLAALVDGATVETVEGLARDGALHPIQQAFVAKSGFQCGFCTPGFILMTKELLERHPEPTDEEIRQYLSGNLCRCAAYPDIIEAVKMAAELTRYSMPMSTSAPHDSTFTLSDGSALAYTLHRAPGPRLVLIHSLALDRSVWDGVVERLRTDAQILTYDCRGHGRSSHRAGRFTAELFARDLAELLDRVGWQDATVAGCSMGGSVALAFAGLFPARATALGLIDTTAWYGADAPAKFRERADAARAKGMQGLIDFQVTRWFSDEFRAAHPEVLRRTSAVFVANDVDCYAASCALLGDVDLRAHLPAFRMPVSVVVGEEDYATPVEMARQLHEAIPHSTLTVLPRARHLTPIEHPDAIAAQLGDLLKPR